jgi:hypothetical protein
MDRHRFLDSGKMEKSDIAEKVKVQVKVEAKMRA